MLVTLVDVPRVGELDPVVFAESLIGGHRLMWTVESGWSCSCPHQRSNRAPHCEHIAKAAMRLPPDVANHMVNACRRARPVDRRKLAVILAREAPERSLL